MKLLPTPCHREEHTAVSGFLTCPTTQWHARGNVHRRLQCRIKRIGMQTSVLCPDDPLKSFNDLYVDINVLSIEGNTSTSLPVDVKKKFVRVSNR